MLDPGDGELRRLAETALAEQDSWTDDRHRGFWQALEPLWPYRTGTVPTRQRLDALVGYLLSVAPAFNWSRADVASIIGVAPDSLRRQRYGLGDRKTRWWPGTGDRRERLPRVYRWGDPEPDGYPAIPVRPPRAPALEQIEEAARSALDRATADGRCPRILHVFALSDGSISTLVRGWPAGADEILAIAQSGIGQIAYDPIRVALGLEWMAAPAPAPSVWEELGRTAEGTVRVKVPALRVGEVLRGPRLE